MLLVPQVLKMSRISPAVLILTVISGIAYVGFFFFFFESFNLWHPFLMVVPDVANIVIN